MIGRKKSVRKISDYMSASPYFVSPQSKCDKAIKEMTKHKVKHLPVTSQGKIVGLLSERDLRLVCLQSPEKFLVTDVMSPDPYVVNSDESLLGVVKEMKKRRIGCAIVRDVFGQPKGVFTSTDALSLLENLLEPS